MNDSDLEAAMSAAHFAMLAALAKGDKRAAIAHEKEKERLRGLRTQQQRERALNLAGLNQDGTPKERTA